MKGATSRQKPAESRLAGLGGFARRASGLFIPGKAARKIEDHERDAAERRQTDKQVRFREHRSHGVSVVRRWNEHPTKVPRGKRKRINRARNKQARISRRRNRVG